MIKKLITSIIAGCLLMAGLPGCKKNTEFTHKSGAPMTIDNFTPTEGGGTTEMLITGSNFSADTSKIKVTINGLPLTIIGVNGNQLMAVVPKKCGSGHVVVSVGKDSIVSTGIFNYKFLRKVSTLAGNGHAGFVNAQGTDAQFDFSSQAWFRSMGLAVDENLNVYVADPGNHCIRKIDSLGNVTTLAGNPNSGGYADGQGTSAKFSIPYDVTVDAEGNVWSADPGNWDIRKISPDGTATTWAWASQDPWAVAFDKTTGFVYYTGANSPGNIYQLTAQWTSTEVVSGLNYPAGIGFDRVGNLYAAINGDQVVKQFKTGTWEGKIIAGTSGVAGYLNGPGSASKFSYPWGLATDASGNVYIAGNGTWDSGTYNADQSIRIIEAGTWDVSTFAGSGSAGYVDAVGEAASFSGPTGVTVDKNGTVYVLDKNNNRIRKIISE